MRTFGARTKSDRGKVLTVDGGGRPHAHAQRLGLLGVPVLQLQRLRVVVIDAVHQALGVGVCASAKSSQQAAGSHKNFLLI